MIFMKTKCYILALGMALVIMTGCGNNTQGSESQTANADISSEAQSVVTQSEEAGEASTEIETIEEFVEDSYEEPKLSYDTTIE